MNREQIRSSELENVREVLLLITQALKGLGDQNACILHCKQPHRSSFFHQIELEFGVSALLCYQGDGIKAMIKKIMLGVSALIVLNNYDEITSLFVRIGEQSMAALYVVNKSTLEVVPNLLQMSTSEILNVIKEDSANFVYQVDEDSAGEDGKVHEYFSFGSECPNVLKNIEQFIS